MLALSYGGCTLVLRRPGAQRSFLVVLLAESGASLGIRFQFHLQELVLLRRDVAGHTKVNQFSKFCFVHLSDPLLGKPNTDTVHQLLFQSRELFIECPTFATEFLSDLSNG